jgi:succinate dehydrogenase/fumarate reductase cytochrome b subunit
MKVFWKVNMWIHRISGFLIFAATITLSGLLFKDKDYEIEDNLHSIIGVVILAIVILISMFGIFTKSKMENM